MCGRVGRADRGRVSSWSSARGRQLVSSGCVGGSCRDRGVSVLGSGTGALYRWRVPTAGTASERQGQHMWGTMTGPEDVLVGGLILMAAGGLVLYVGRLIAEFLGL